MVCVTLKSNMGHLKLNISVLEHREKAFHAQNLKCAHCNSKIDLASGPLIQDNNQNYFCCSGCRVIYTAIENCDLGEYYKIRNQFIDAAKPATEYDATAALKEKFAYLDAIEVRKEYLTHDQQMFFFITGIQCAACVWILEKISELSPGIQSVRVDAVRQLAAVKLNDGGAFADFASWAQVFGYSVRPVQLNENLNLLSTQARRSDLRRIGVAAVCAGNIMLLSTSVYLGADAIFEKLFNWVSLALTIPVIVYGAQPMIRGAWGAMRARVPTLDLPIVVAVLGGFILSIYQMIWGAGRVYFDSISILVLLILSSRYFVHRMQEKFLAYEGDAYSLIPSYAKKVLPTQNTFNLSAQTQIVSTNQLVVGDLICIDEGEKIPADGKVVAGTAWVRESVLTGEPLPRAVLHDSLIFAGTTLLTGRAIMQVTALGAKTQIGELQTTSTTSALLKSNVGRRLETWAQNFTYLVMAIGLIVCVYFSYVGLFAVGFERMLSLFIVACPCALAFGAPLIFSKALLWASSRGVFLRSADVFEKLNNIQNIVFDKTGTLTQGQLKLTSISNTLSNENRQAIVAIESQVAHPIAQSIVSALSSERSNSADLTVTDFQILPGRGVQARVAQRLYQILASETPNIEQQNTILIWVDVFCDGQKLCQFGFEDKVRHESADVINAIRRNQIKNYWILSGDRKENVEAVAHATGIEIKNCFAKQKPEDKELKLNGISQAMMIGDGVNDARAMAKAQVAVIVGGALERALNVADVFLTQDGLKELPLLWQIKRRTDKAFLRIRYFSISYNFLTGLLAVTGFISPLVAAILMPVSSISVLLISLLSVRRPSEAKI